MNRLTYLNPDSECIARTLRATYYKVSDANLLFNTRSGFVAGGNNRI